LDTEGDTFPLDMECGQPMPFPSDFVIFAQLPVQKI